MEKEKKIQIEISTNTILKLALAILIFWFLFIIHQIVVLFLLVLIIVAALTPLVDRMTKYMPRALAVTLLALGFLAVLIVFGFLIVPPLSAEIKQLAINLPIIISKFGPIYHNFQLSIGNYQESILNISSQVGQLTSGIYSTTIGFISGIVGLVTMLVLTFYMLIDKETINTYFYGCFSKDKQEKVAKVVTKISEKMSQWLGGHLFLMLVVGILYGLALAILGVPYSLVLAIWGGLVEIIPYLGPWLAIVPAVLIAFTISPITALFVFIAYIIIQQLESHFLTPKIIGQAVGLSPVIIILALLIGAKLMGLLGVIIAVPVAAIISVLVLDWSEIKKLWK